MNIKEVLVYEICASWWVEWLSWEWAQDLAGKWFAWKVNRKFTRYQKSITEWEDLLKRVSDVR